MSLIITLFVIFCVALGITLGALRGLWRTLYRAGLGIVCSALSFLTTILTAGKFSGLLYEKFTPLLTVSDGKKLTEVIALYPTVEKYAKNILSAIVAIPLFLACLILFSIIGYVFYLIFRKKFKSAKDSNKWLRIPSGAVGAVMGFLLAIIVLTPVAFLSGTAKPLLPLLPEKTLPAFVIDGIGECAENPLVKLSYSSPFLDLFDAYTGYGEKNLKSNLRADTASATEIMLSMNELKDIGKIDDKGKQIEALGTLLDTVSGSPMLTKLYTEVLTVSSDRLLNGQDVMGMTYDDLMEKAPSLAQLEPFPKDLLTFFAGTTVENAPEDFKLLSEFGTALVNSGLLEEKKDEENLLDSFREPEKTASLIEPLLKYPRSKNLVGSVLNVGLQLVSEKVGLPESQPDVYRSIISEIADKWETTLDEKRTALVSDTLRKYKFEADDTVAAYIAGVIKTENPKTYDAETFGKIFGESLEALLPNAKILTGGTDLTEDEIAVIRKLTSEETFTSDSITTEKLLSYLQKSTEETGRNDPATEAKYLGEAVSSLGKVAKVFEESGDTVSPESIKEIGKVITDLIKTDSVPQELVHDLAKGVIDLRLNSGFGAVTDLVVDSLDKDEDGKEFEKMIDTSAASYSVINSITGDTPTNVADIETLVRNMTPDIANAVSTSIDSKFFENSGLNETRSNNCSNLVHSILDHASTYKTDKDEGYKNEADALNYLFTFMQSASKNVATPIFDEGKTPEHLTETVLSSEIVSAAIKDTCKNEKGEMIMDPLEISPLLLEEERIGIRNALNERAKTANEEEKQTLGCLASMLLNETLK